MWLNASNNIICLGKHPKEIEQGVYGILHYLHLHYLHEDNKL